MQDLESVDRQSAEKALLEAVTLAQRYCYELEHAREMERNEFISEMLNILPRIYITFTDLSPENLPGGAEFGYFPEYVDEDFYESVRRNVGNLIGADDIFLETFEEDMKYSDTPIAASVSECLADIFQPLYNFICAVKDSGMEEGGGAYGECHANFENYWAQTLCNVMRALNSIRYSSPAD